MDQTTPSNRSIFWLILITGLGFFIDGYDAFSYNVMRMQSLTEWDLSVDALAIVGCSVLGIGFLSVLLMRETYHANLEQVEK